ncbi:MAG: hypothetical protein A2Y62_12950 [Candidatus Fischerbacteria bacterium RBG_13_37_8]|uniref:HTH merR-type domain-containing protein n=1 Tax=Candidatus Fischerbacteria bacterium RBG_13_37_8 TaxID=1817863 RepID=A0A1F5V5Y7_9BACT|nr:MAG: hypothetical protein A2Y62_12950 [Candidatus Fischerbacteria bacterium RBG_13_37_8]
MPRKIGKVIDKKDSYTIGEVASILEIPSYVLRFWETEFAELKPHKNVKGHRLYNNEDLEIAKIIKRLMHEELYTLEGAKKKIKQLLQNENDNNPRSSTQSISTRHIQNLRTIKNKLLVILTLLNKNSIK